MGLELVSTPERTKDAVISIVSACKSQAPFEFQRKDFDNADLREDTLNPGFVKFNLPSSAGDVTSQFPVGYTFEYRDAVPASLNGTYTVRVSDFTSNTNVRCNEVFTVISTTNGYIQMPTRQDYQMLFEVMEADGVTPITTALFVKSPRSDGYLFFNLAQVLFGLMDGLGELIITYRLRYAEYYDGITGPTALTVVLNGIIARRQIGKELGANLWYWTLKPLTNGFYGRLLTDFHEPKVWRTQKRTLGVLFDHNLPSRLPAGDILIKGYPTNINYVDTGIAVTINVPLATYDTPQIYDIDMDTFLADPSFNNASYIRLVVENSAAAQLANELFVKILPNECQNDVMLQWVNDVGSWEQWVFTYNQEVVEEAITGDTIEIPINQDYSTVRKTKDQIVFSERQYITLTAEELTKAEVRALKYIKAAPIKQVELQGNFYDVVIKDTFATAWQTVHRLHTFSVTIEMPEEFDYFENVP